MTSQGTDSRRITFVIPSLTSGGAERVMVTMLNHWAAKGGPGTLLTIYDRDPDFYTLHPAVTHTSLAIAKDSPGPASAVWNNVSRNRALLRAIVTSRPDVVISFLSTTNVATILATFGTGIPVVVEEHTDPARLTLSRAWSKLRDVTYPHADRVVVLSDTAQSYFSRRIRSRCVIIPNPIVIEPPREIVTKTEGRKKLIAVGRLGPEKGFDLLLDTFARVAERNPSWDLVIWGEGAERTNLEAQRRRLGLKDRVSLPGLTRTPHDEMRQADLFVMSSRREGFPMALGEAMACGLPVISTDCPSGPRQLIRPGIDGLLVDSEDTTALAGALDELMINEPLRTSLALRAPEILDRFGLDRVMLIWEQLLDDVVMERRARRIGGIRTFGSVPAAVEQRAGRYDETPLTARER